jgi:hypothetical protein
VAGVVVAAFGASALVVLAWRVRMMVHREGVTVCEGFATRRMSWDEIDHIGAGRRQLRFDKRWSGHPCLEITTRTGEEPLRPRATMRTHIETLQTQLSAIRRYAPHGTRVRRWDDVGAWPG